MGGRSVVSEDVFRGGLDVGRQDVKNEAIFG